MTETVRVLTLAERLLSVAVVGVLAAGTVSAAAVERLRLPTGRRPPPPPPAQRRRPPSPVAKPSPAAPKPPPPKQAAPVPAIAAPEPPRAGCPVPRRPSSGKPYRPRQLKPPAVADAALPKPLPPAARPAASRRSPARASGSPTSRRRRSTCRRWSRRAKAAGPGQHLGAHRRPAGLLRQPVPARAGPRGARGRADGRGLGLPLPVRPVADAQRARQAFADGIDAFAPTSRPPPRAPTPRRQRVTLYLSLVRSYAGDRPDRRDRPPPDAAPPRDLPVPGVPAVRRRLRADGLLVVQRAGQLSCSRCTSSGGCCRCTPSARATTWATRAAGAVHPTEAETWRFIDVAHRGGAIGTSLWTIERLGPASSTR
jgi:hypothetical protein